MTARLLTLALLPALLLAPGPVHAQRPTADLACASAGTALVYDCTVRLRHGGRPLEGAEVTVGADMPSMPMAHNVRPVQATPGSTPGEYRLRLELEMRGEWAVKLRLGGPVRDLLILHYHFDETGAAPASQAPGHRH